jgi:hypothetical protein
MCLAGHGLIVVTNVDTLGLWPFAWDEARRLGTEGETE